jgi:hypothetical protein
MEIKVEVEHDRFWVGFCRVLDTRFLPFHRILTYMCYCEWKWWGSGCGNVDNAHTFRKHTEAFRLNRRFEEKTA